MAFVLQAQGRMDEAEGHFRAVLEAARRTLGDEHQLTLNAFGNLGFLYRAQGRTDDAEPYYRQALELKRQALGDGHPDTLVALHNMGCMLVDQGRLEEAQACFREALSGRLRALGAEHPKTDDSIFRVGDTGERLVAAARESGDDERLGRALARSGSHRWVYGDPAEAERELREALSLLEARVPHRDVELQRAASELGAALLAQGRLEEAEPYLRRSAQWALETPREGSEAPDRTREIVRRLIDHHETVGAATEAEAWRARLGQWDDTAGE